jgi:type VI secretion system secreted protein Hcp
MAVDYFLKIDGIEGESSDEKHAKEIEVASFTWNEAQSGTFAEGSGGGSGKVRMGNFIYTQRTSKASPKLMLACAKGDHIKSAVLTCRKAGGGQQEFYKITLSDVMVASYETASSNGEEQDPNLGYHDGVPMDRVELNFAKIECEYRPQKEDGSLDNPVKAGYNLKTNTAV